MVKQIFIYLKIIHKFKEVILHKEEEVKEMKYELKMEIEKS